MLVRATGSWTKEEARHLLNRAGFGGSPGDVARFHAMGREAAVDSLLEPEESIEDYPRPEWAEPETAMIRAAAQVQEGRKIRLAARGLSPEEAQELRKKSVKPMQMEIRQQTLESQGWWFRRMLKTEAPLREKMVLFWHDHFATSIQKTRFPVLMMQQNELFREFAFGNFRELTGRMVKDPAMMIYLDTQRSNKTMPNENFAREVMELFTLGEGNYTEADVKEAARAFTGYKLDRQTGEVTHWQGRWDGGEKEVFGKSGRFRGEDVVDLIFEREACAEFMARKLWVYFADEKPTEETVKSLAGVFREGGYEVKPVLRDVFLSREFYSENVVGSQIKCPLQYLVQMLKELEMDEPPPGFPMMGQNQLGQVLFMPPNVAGWDWGKAWINTNTLLTRYNLAGRLTKGAVGEEMPRGRRNRRMKGDGGSDGRGAGPAFVKIATEEERNATTGLVAGLMERFFSTPVPEKARRSFIEYAEAKKGVSFTDTELGELCHLMMSTPYYQLC